MKKLDEKKVMDEVEVFVKNNPGLNADQIITQVASSLEVDPRIVRRSLKRLGDIRKIYARGLRLYHKDYFEASEDSSSQASESVVSGLEAEDYLIAWDLELKKLSEAEARRIYRRLEKVYYGLIEKGVKIEKIQRSIWRVRGREAVGEILGAFPDGKVKMNIFRIIEEAKIE